MCELGRRARELCQELKSYDRLTLPPYNEELMRLVFCEVNEHNSHAEELFRDLKQLNSEAAPEAVTAPKAATLITHYECIKRNKRLLLIYMNERMERLRTMRWQHRCLPQPQTERCSPMEIQFFREYDRALAAYMGPDGIAMDLTVETRPPRDTLVAVRALKDIGEVYVASGLAHLYKGDVLAMTLDDAELLLRENAVEVVPQGC